MPTLLNSSKKLKRRERSQAYFVRPALPWYQSQIRILHEKKTTDQYPLMNILNDAKYKSTLYNAGVFYNN